MKVVAIIAEYNPFHKGHQYQIQKTKEYTNADYVIVIMSGHFSQRGIPAVFLPEDRAKTALHYGADLVLELPLSYATGSAERFAFGGVDLATSIGVCDYLSFGSEKKIPEDFETVLELLLSEPDSYRKSLHHELQNGKTYAEARCHALQKEGICDESLSFLTSPNSILATEYLKSIKRLRSTLSPVVVLRNGDGYHEEVHAQTCYASATGIRRLLLEGNPTTALSYLPDGVSPDDIKYPLFQEDFDLLLHSALCKTTREQLNELLDLPPNLADRMVELRDSFTSWESFATRIKTKDRTRTAIDRALLHLLLQVTEIDGANEGMIISKTAYPHVPYARVLGFREDAAPLLSAMQKSSKIPIITRLTDSANFSEYAAAVLSKELEAGRIYRAVLQSKYHTPIPSEWKLPVQKIKG